MRFLKAGISSCILLSRGPYQAINEYGWFAIKCLNFLFGGKKKKTVALIAHNFMLENFSATERSSHFS